MIDAISQAVTVADGAGSAVGPAAAGSSDVERFRQVLFAPRDVADSAVPAVATPVPETVTAPPKNLGEAIISTLQSASTEMGRNWNAAAQMVTQPDLNMADMLRLQMTVVQTSIQYDLLGKAISKSTNNLDQILKTQ